LEKLIKIPTLRGAFRPPESMIVLLERIRCRAKALYELRGRKDGCNLDGWLQAKSEILSAEKTAEAAWISPFLCSGAGDWNSSIRTGKPRQCSSAFQGTPRFSSGG